MSTPPQQPSEEELRAMYEEQMKRVRVEDVLMQGVVDLINLGMRRTGMVEGTEDERDAEQVRVAVEGVRALMPLVESIVPDQVNQIRAALSQLQLAYVRIGGQAPASQPARGESPPAGASDRPATPEGGPPPKPGDAGPAQRSGRLWVPGQ
jgi:hypothetical protein